MQADESHGYLKGPKQPLPIFFLFAPNPAFFSISTRLPRSVPLRRQVYNLKTAKMDPRCANRSRAMPFRQFGVIV